VDAGLLARFDYAALGHLHSSQGAGGNVRYAGSPIKYSFSEWKQDKSATLVELKEKGSVTVAALPLRPLHDMREIKGPIEKLLSDEVSSQGSRDDYMRVILTDEDEVIDPTGKIRSVYPNVMALDFDNSRTRIDGSGIQPETGQPEKLSPYDMFSEFFLKMSGCVMSAEQAEIVRELLEKEGEE